MERDQRRPFCSGPRAMRMGPKRDDGDTLCRIVDLTPARVDIGTVIGDEGPDSVRVVSAINSRPVCVSSARPGSATTRDAKWLPTVLD